MNIITLQDKKYPKLLKMIGKDAPKHLYYKGTWDKDIFKNCLAVVGSRHLTGYGRQVTEKLVTEIAASGITIVSGFMYGGDAVAHQATIKAGGRTIAVMPCGIDLIRPDYQGDLYKEILENKGLIISEYEGDLESALWTFPKRNRIVAGLSGAVLVVEAGLKSGSLITAEYAKNFNRKVFAVPGPITSEVSQGTLQLIREGAEIVVSAKDVLSFYGLSSVGLGLTEYKNAGGELKTSASLPDPLEKKILGWLQRESLGADELARNFGIPIANLGTTLSMMQLKGLIEQDGGKYRIN